jgi:splicing factor 3B subunit 3
VVGSDSGRLTILEYKAEKERFDVIHQETYGKTGCRRIVPGEYLAVDPKGRAIMVGAIEKQKFVYVLNRENNEVTISSPLEAHKPHNIVFDMCGLDVGYSNPVFACLEIDYGETDSPFSAVMTGKPQKNLVLYELDLGLNHVIRNYCEEVDSSAHLLLPIPADPEGPGGVIVVCENFIVYKKVDHDDRECPIPRRNDMDQDRKLFIINYTIHKQKNLFFFIIQSDLGDMYKVSLNFTDEQVHSIQCQYFDTIMPCSALCLIKTGFIFAAAEFGDHYCYQITGLGDDDDKPIVADSSMDKDYLVAFNSRGLKNIAPVDEIKNMGCITNMECVDLLDEGNPQIYLTCGRGPLTTLRIVRHGLQINQMADSPMPDAPTGIWTLKEKYGDDFDKLMIVSFPSSTLVLSIGAKIGEVTDSGFDNDTNTILAFLLQDDSAIQVFPSGIIHIKQDGKRNQWKSTTGTINYACSNERQVVISLEGGEIRYFELDSVGNLVEVGSKIMDTEITCLDVGPIQEGRQRSRYLAVGCEDTTVKVLSLDPENCLSRVSVQALPALPSSVCLIEMKNNTGALDIDQLQLFLHIGLANGLLLRATVDLINSSRTSTSYNQLTSDSRARYLGTKPIKLIKVNVHGQPAMLALSSRPWLCYNYMSKYTMAPLSYDPIEFAS